jgi:pimeloyl-ACP methyl ester carboxylesterase
MDHLHIRTAVVGGLSKGGFVAAAFYDEYPERTLGLLLEDGGSWSPQRLRDEKPFAGRLLKEIIKEAKEPEKIYSTRIRIFQTYYRAWAETDAQIDPTQVYSAVNVLASFRARPDGKWVSHVNRDLMIKKDVTAASFKMPSSQPLFQWSNQAMIPEIIFRNLHIPVYIIDPVSKHDMFPVGHQNRKLKSQHPSLIVHEVYEDTGHLAHFQRPERFVKTATALIDRVKKVSREAL